MKTPHLSKIALALLVSAAGCGEPKPEKKRDVLVPVVAEVSVVRPIVAYVDTVGYVDAQVKSRVGSTLPGRIVLMTRDVGDLIPGKCGDPVKDRQALLARLDTAALEAQEKRLDAEVRLAEANLPQLKQDWEREEKLLKAGSGTERRRDQAKAAHDVARAKVETVKAARNEVRVGIAQSSIYAPVDAAVIKKLANVGDVVNPGQPLYQLECIRDLKINVILPERDVPKVRAKKEARITFDALPGEEFTGAIHAVIPSGDPLSHSFTAEIRFRNRFREDDKQAGKAIPLPDALPAGLTCDRLLMKPGMFARVKIVKYQKEGATVVPKRCVVEDGAKTYVYLIDPEGRAKKQKVTIGVVMGQWAEAVQGLKPGQKVVGRGIENVTEGQSVRVTRIGGATSEAERAPAVTAR